MSPLKNYETRKHDAILKNAYRKSVIVIKLYNNHIYIYIIHIIYILSFYFYQLVIAKVWNQGKKKYQISPPLITYEKKFSYNFTCKKTIPFPASSDKQFAYFFPSFHTEERGGNFLPGIPPTRLKLKKKKKKGKKNSVTFFPTHLVTTTSPFPPPWILIPTERGRKARRKGKGKERR